MELNFVACEYAKYMGLDCYQVTIVHTMVGKGKRVQRHGILCCNGVGESVVGPPAGRQHLGWSRSEVKLAGKPNKIHKKCATYGCGQLH